MDSAAETVPAAIRRLCVAVDIASYSSRTRPAQIDAQNRLLWTMAQGCLAAEVNPARCAREDSGDGQILILPTGVDEARVIPGLVKGLLTAVHRVNHPEGPAKRIRLRISLGQGAVQMGQNGFISPSVITICRLLDSDELRDALAARPTSDAALVVTTDLFDEMVSQGYGGLPAEGFAKIRVRKPRKGFDAEGWVQVPDSRPFLATIPVYSDPADLKRKQQAPGSPGGLLPVVAATAIAWAVFAGHGSTEHAPGNHGPAGGPHHPNQHGPNQHGPDQHAGWEHNFGDAHLGPASAFGYLADALPHASIPHSVPHSGSHPDLSHDAAAHQLPDPGGHAANFGDDSTAGAQAGSYDPDSDPATDYASDDYYGDGAYGSGTSGSTGHHWFHDLGPGHQGTY